MIHCTSERTLSSLVSFASEKNWVRRKKKIEKKKENND